MEMGMLGLLPEIRNKSKSFFSFYVPRALKVSSRAAKWCCLFPDFRLVKGYHHFSPSTFHILDSDVRQRFGIFTERALHSYIDSTIIRVVVRANSWWTFRLHSLNS